MCAVNCIAWIVMPQSHSFSSSDWERLFGRASGICRICSRMKIIVQFRSMHVLHMRFAHLNNFIHTISAPTTFHLKLIISSVNAGRRNRQYQFKFLNFEWQIKVIMKCHLPALEVRVIYHFFSVFVVSSIFRFQSVWIPSNRGTSLLITINRCIVKSAVARRGNCVNYFQCNWILYASKTSTGLNKRIIVPSMNQPKQFQRQRQQVSLWIEMNIVSSCVGRTQTRIRTRTSQISTFLNHFINDTFMSIVLFCRLLGQKRYSFIATVSMALDSHCDISSSIHPIRRA